MALWALRWGGSKFGLRLTIKGIVGAASGCGPLKLADKVGFGRCVAGGRGAQLNAAPGDTPAGQDLPPFAPIAVGPGGFTGVALGAVAPRRWI